MKQNQQRNANLKNHPSFQSKSKPFKPCIKVEYKVIHSQKIMGCQNLGNRYGRKMFINKADNEVSFVSVSNNSQKVSRVKSVEGSLRHYESGKFVGSEYCPNQNNNIKESIHTSRKGKIQDSKLRYQHSKSVQNIIKEQNIKKRAPSCFISESRMTNKQSQSSSKVSNNQTVQYSQNSKSSRVSQRSKLPSYTNEGIKDIIEYRHAGTYIEQKVTPKCGKNANVLLVKDRFRAFNEIHEFDFRKRMNTLSNQIRLTRGLR